MEDIIIIGAGPVGLYAGTLAALHNLKGIIFESLPNVGGQLTSLYPEKAIIDLPGFKSILAKDYIDELYAQQQSVNNPLPVHLNEKVISYKKEEDYFVVTTSLSTYKTKTILICSGMGSFEPRKAGLENEDKLNNVIYSITEKEKYRNKNIAILGGGDSAIDWAITLKDIAKEVYIVHRRDEFRGQSSSVNLMIEKGVKVYKPYLVKSFNGIGNAESITLTHSITKEEVKIDVDFIFVNYGLITAPCAFNLESKNNTFIVNSCYMTSENNIFAIGNAVYYDGKVKNITSGLGEAVIAITKIDQIIHPNKNIPVHF